MHRPVREFLYELVGEITFTPNLKKAHYKGFVHDIFCLRLLPYRLKIP